MLDELEDDGSSARSRRGEIDVGFVAAAGGRCAARDGRAASRPLRRDRRGSLAAGRRPLDLARGRRATAVGFRDDHGAAPIDAAFRAAGIEPRWAFRSNDNPTIQGLVAAGLGVAVMPRLTVDATDPRIAVVELEPPLPPRILAVAQHRDRYSSPAARAFVETARETVATRP